jgi:two-component system OmpR family sensor kinase
MTSIRRALLVPLAAGLVVAIVAAGYFTYQRARDEANALFDVQLQQTAASITGMPLAPPESAFRGEGSTPLVVQIWNRDGVQVFRSQPTRDAPARAAPGFTTIATNGGAWRVYSVLANGQVIQVGQPLAVRDELATSMAWRTTLPLILIAPLLALFIWLAIERALRPLARLTGAVGRRGADELTPLADAGWPEEVAPLVAALNALLDKLRHALSAQRAFVADAAHELRTPLAALHLQAQLAERAADDAERASAMRAMKGGIDRATRLASQLLTLAREEHADVADAHARVALATLVQDVAREQAPIAAARDVDLGVTESAPLAVEGDPAALYTLVSNLVDNAVRYTPRGGRVDVAVGTRDGAPAIVVRDTGPGIPADERAHVFDRFARGAQASAPGSGLGLAIVKRIAERHGARVDFEPGVDGKGLGVVVRFAAAAAEPHAAPASAPAAAPRP